MKLGVCLEMIFTDRPFLERIERAADIGFAYGEMWFADGTYNGTDCRTGLKDPITLAATARKAGMTISCLTIGSPDGSIGGGLTDPARREQWLRRARDTFAFAKAAGIPGTIVCTGNLVPGLTTGQMRASVVEGLKRTAEIAEREGITLLLEPLNTLVDHPGYFLSSITDGAALCREVGSECLQLLFDCYHVQIMEARLTEHIRDAIDVIGHIHAAGVPGRHELWTGQIDYPSLIAEIKGLEYEGIFALEYRPAMDDEESLRKALKIAS